MWRNISKLILGNRILIIVAIVLFTILFGFFSSKIKLQYELNKLIPQSDPIYIAYDNFKLNFGQDGLMLVIATTEPDFYNKDKFNAWLELADSIQNVKVLVTKTDTSYYKNVVDSVFSEGHLYNIIKNKKEQRFDLVEIIEKYPAISKDLLFNNCKNPNRRYSHSPPSF